jgi:hypothetical protein
VDKGLVFVLLLKIYFYFYFSFGRESLTTLNFLLFWTNFQFRKGAKFEFLEQNLYDVTYN